MQRNRTKSWSGFTAGLVLSLGFTSASLAEDSDTAGDSSPDGATITLPEMSVSAPADRAFFAPDTASQGVVTGEQIQQQPVYRVGETLEVVPGLIVTQHSGEGKANQYFLRGFNLDHGTDIDISLDDMPVNMRTHAHGQGYADLNFMIPELISTLQYSKGPYFPALGDFDTAGAVQIKYVDTLPHDLALLSAGMFGYGRGLGAVSRPVGAGNLLVAAEYVHADGPWTIPDNYNKGNLVANYSQGNTDNGFSFTGMYMNDAFHATNQIPQRAVTEGLICLYCPLDPTDGGSSERYSFSTKYAATTDTGQLKANAYLIGNQLQLFNNFDGFVTFPPPIGDQFVQQDRRKIYGGNVSYMIPGNIFGFDAQNTVGLQTRTDDIHIDLAETTGRVVRFTVRDDHVTEASGLMIENRIQWLDKFRTVTGLREDLYYGSDESTLQANSGTIVQAITSPKGNLVLGPWNQTEYYLSVGQGFHSNDLRGALTTVNALQTEINFQQGNPTVVPQVRTPLLTKATGYEVGVRSEPVPNLKLEGALFVLNLASEATFDGDEAETTPGRPSQRKGVELSASYKPLPWLRLDGDFAATHARYANGDPGTADTEPGHPGSYIPNSPDLISTASATVEDFGPWFGALKFRYFGRRPLIEDDSVTSRPTTLVDLRIGYKFSEQVKLWLDVFNLFNNTRAHQIDYFYPSQLANEKAPVYDIHFKPVEPASVRLTFSMTF
jgi:TonB dependent receptor-like, beta-barrel/TonB-dependent Receptor Plug Domain